MMGFFRVARQQFPPHKTLFKIEINFATNFTKLVAKRQDTSAR